MKFETKVYKTKDKKPSRIYRYGTINIRTPKLIKWIGKSVNVFIYLNGKKKKTSESND